MKIPIQWKVPLRPLLLERTKGNIGLLIDYMFAMLIKIMYKVVCITVYDCTNKCLYYLLNFLSNLLFIVCLLTLYICLHMYMITMNAGTISQYLDPLIPIFPHFCMFIVLSFTHSTLHFVCFSVFR